MTLFRPLLLLIALLLGSAANAKPIDVIGTISGSVGDRQHAIWVMLMKDGQSTATFDDVAGVTAVNLQSHRSAFISAKGSVTVSFNLMPNGAVIEPNVLMLPGKSLSTFYEAADGSIKLEIKSIKREDGQLIVEGTAKGQIFRTTRSGVKVETDKNDAIAVDITFEATATQD